MDPTSTPVLDVETLGVLASLTPAERVAYAIEVTQPFRCECAQSCAACRHRLGRHHYHCACGAHLHLTRIQSRDTICFFDHIIDEHFPGAEAGVHAEPAAWQQAVLDASALTEAPLSSYDVERVVLHERQDGLCFYCRRWLDWRHGHVDHLVPELKGSYEGEALELKALAHPRCHELKTRGRRDDRLGRRRTR